MEFHTPNHIIILDVSKYFSQHTIQQIWKMSVREQQSVWNMKLHTLQLLFSLNSVSYLVVSSIQFQMHGSMVFNYIVYIWLSRCPSNLKPWFSCYVHSLYFLLFSLHFENMFVIVAAGFSFFFFKFFSRSNTAVVL